MRTSVNCRPKYAPPGKTGENPLAALLGGTPAIDGVPAAIAADATARGALDFAVA